MKIVKDVQAAVGITNIEGVATLSGLEGIFKNIVSVALSFAGVAFFIMLLIAGFNYLTSSGDPKQVEQAKKAISNAVLGLVLVSLSYLFLVFLSSFTNLNLTEFKIFQP